MKIIQLIILLLIFTSCGVKKNLDYSDIILKIKSEKTNYKNNHWVNLYVIINNNSNQDITILKPSTKYGYQMDFFDVKYQCEDVSITEVTEKTPVIIKTEADLITIKAKSEIELLLKGNLLDVICDSNKITQVKVTYNTSKEFPEWLVNEIGNEQLNLIKKLTQLKIESKEVLIE